MNLKPMEILTRDITNQSNKRPRDEEDDKKLKRRKIVITYDGTNWLPDDILLEIFRKLSRLSVAHSSMVCQDWYRVSCSEELAWVTLLCGKFREVVSLFFQTVTSFFLQKMVQNWFALFFSLHSFFFFKVGFYYGSHNQHDFSQTVKISYSPHTQYRPPDAVSWRSRHRGCFTV